MGKTWRVTVTIKDECAGSEPLVHAEQVADFVKGRLADGSVVEVVLVHVHGRWDIHDEGV